MIVTALTEMFKLTHPIVLGPMGGVSGGRLAAVADAVAPIRSIDSIPITPRTST